MNPTTPPVVVERDMIRVHSWNSQSKPSTPKVTALIKQITKDAYAQRKASVISEGKRYVSLSKPNRRKFERTIEALVCSVIAFERTTRHDATKINVHYVSLSHATIGASKASDKANNRALADRIKELVAIGVLTQRTLQGPDVSITSTEAGPVLLSYIDQHKVTIHDIGMRPENPRVQFKSLKGKAGKRSMVPTPRGLREDAHAAQKALEQLNAALATADVSARPDGPELDLRRLKVSRVFNDRSFQNCGRYTDGFWLTLPKKLRRKYLRIDGMPIAEVDVRASQPSLAYATVCQRPEGDPYDLSPVGITDIDRSTIKPLFMQLLWKPLNGSTRWPKDVLKVLQGRYGTREVYDAIRERNAPIAHLLGSEDPIGAKLMFTESEIITKATLECFSRGLTCLPIHDALAVRVDAGPVARDVLHRAFTEIAGVEPEVDLKTSWSFDE